MSKKIIGVYPMFNTGGICVHAIDDAEDKVLASVNGENPEWCEMAEQPQEDGDEMESGFLFGSFFVAFSGVIRMEWIEFQKGEVAHDITLVSVI